MGTSRIVTAGSQSSTRGSRLAPTVSAVLRTTLRAKLARHRRRRSGGANDESPTRRLVALDVVGLACDRRARRAAAGAQDPTEPAEASCAPPQTHWIHEGPAGRGAGPVTADMLKNAPADPSTWLHFGGNYATWRHSPIKALTPASLKDLRVAWMLPTGVAGPARGLAHRLRRHPLRHLVAEPLVRGSTR